MRAGLSTIQQTLTPESASVLNQSIAEAARRSHSQTTPLHVAATLLASPAGLFRQACARSHPNSSHPLQCRALELCFSVALDRLPSSNSNPPAAAASGQSGGGNGASGAGAVEQPPISNALMAALKRAQAHQRRGCPEQQQQPLLAVKVELEQLVISILDDPSVSRVMREASFSSPAVKATIQQSLVASTPPLAIVTATTFSPSPSPAPADPRPLGNGIAGGQLALLRPPVAAPGTSLLPANRNLYLNPRLQQQQLQQQGSGGLGGGNGFEHHKREEVKRVLDILQRAKKRNPILVSDAEPEAVVKEVLQRIERRDVDDGPLRNAEIISLEKQLPCDRSQIPLRLQELGNSIDLRLKNRDAAGVRGVVLDLGNLTWLVESPGGGAGGTPGSGPMNQLQKAVLEAGRAAVAEMAKLLGRFPDGSGVRIWLIGAADCATYLRCQVYHPTMEIDWDLQAVPIAAGAPISGMLPRINGGKGILSSSVESLSTQKGFPPIGAASTAILVRQLPEKTEPSRETLCPACTVGYESELAKLVVSDFEKSSAESKPEPRKPLPPWLQLANLNNASAKPPASLLQTKEQELKRKQSTEELLKRWTETCSRLHPSVHQAGVGLDKPPMTPLLPMSNMHNSSSLLRQNLRPKLHPAARSCAPLQISNQSSPASNTSARHASPPGSPVRTELVLGRAKPPCEKPPELSLRERLEEPAGCTQDGLAERNRDKVVRNVDIDSFKRLLKGITEKVTWQPEAASLVAATVIQCKSGDGKRRGAGGSRGDAWLLFMGPDKVGKKKMAMALSELVAGTSAVTVSFGDSQADGDRTAHPNSGSRGKTALDKIVEAVRRNPFSVVVLEDIDRADLLVQGSLRRAMERGRLPDSHGREVALGSVIFIMIAHSLPENLQTSMVPFMQSEEKLSFAASSGAQLELAVGEKPGRRRAREEDDHVTKPRKRALGPPGLSLDLNLAAGCDEDAATTECSPNSSDLTVEHDHNGCGRLAVFNRLPKPAISELVGAVDEAVVFKPVDFGELRRKVSDAITRRFKSVVCDGRSLWVEEEALDRVVGGVWFGEMPTAGFEEWTERVLVPGFQQLRGRAAADGGAVVRLLLDKGGAAAGAGEWLPSRVAVAMDGL